MIDEAVRAGRALESVFVAAESLDDDSDDVARAIEAAAATGAAVHAVARGVVERIASTVNPQPVLAVLPFVDVPLAAVERGGLVLVSAGLANPGNLGTVVRAAAASGSRAVVCCAGSVDPYNPKCVRASAGAVLHLPLVLGGEAIQVVNEVKAAGWRCVGTVASGGLPHTEAELGGRVALVLGSEAHGIDPGVADALDGHVTIELAGATESLNVAMAATVLAFEARRQRMAVDR